MVKKEEANDIVQFLIPKLNQVNISISNCKVDTTVKSSGNYRGDIWVSLKKQTDIDFENNIISLIEAKHRNCNVGDIEWRDAMRQGNEKSKLQGLNYYIVTNCKDSIRFYNTFNDDEIRLDGTILTKIVSIEVLQKIQSQVTAGNSEVAHKSAQSINKFTESEFRKTLSSLADIYRSAGLKKGDERIDPTVSFVVMKYISEKENEQSTLHENIKLWDGFKAIASGEEKADLRMSFLSTINSIWGEDSQYKNNQYKDFKDLIIFPQKLKNEHFISIYNELDKYSFHGGANFDLYGVIYEEFASQSKKKEFGEFYTRRHITGMVARLLLSKEIQPRDLKIADPACGTGGFLTEAYKTLHNNYSINNRLNTSVTKRLKKNVLWGFDQEPKSVARTKLNMFLVGDGHTNIYEKDTLVSWDEDIDWIENIFDYIIANPPMGSYKGEANIGHFDFTNEKRYELLFTDRIVKAVKHGGEMAIVINDGALEAPSRVNFRRKLLETCNVTAIISLTKFAFAPYTKEKTYILFMQKKQEDEIGSIQKTPIWHYILDYDGYANSDKRFKTKYHDDIAELEEKCVNATILAKMYISNKEIYNQTKHLYEREVNEREKKEGLFGKKCGFVDIEKVNEENFYNLLSEFYLRPMNFETISMDSYSKSLKDIESEIRSILGKIKNL